MLYFIATFLWNKAVCLYSIAVTVRPSYANRQIVKKIAPHCFTAEKKTWSQTVNIFRIKESLEIQALLEYDFKRFQLKIYYTFATCVVKWHHDKQCSYKSDVTKCRYHYQCYILYIKNCCSEKRRKCPESVLNDRHEKRKEISTLLILEGNSENYY